MHVRSSLLGEFKDQLGLNGNNEKKKKNPGKSQIKANSNVQVRRHHTRTGVLCTSTAVPSHQHFLYKRVC